MSAGAQIDYGAHAATEAIDYGSHAPASPEPKPIGEQYATVGGIAQTMAGQASRAIGAAWENLNPANLIKAGLHPVDTIHAAFNATVDALDRTEAALKKGDHAEALTSVVGAIPLLGPAGEQIVREIEEGKHAEALGHAAGLRLAFEAPKLIPKIAEAAPVVASKAADIATNPKIIKAAGAATGAYAGHLTGVPYVGPAVGAYIGREVGGAISDRLARKVPPVAPASVAPKGVDPKVWEKLPPIMQEQLKAKMAGEATAPPSAPSPQPPRDPSYYGVEPKPAEAPAPQPAPAVPAKPTTIPFEQGRATAAAAKGEANIAASRPEIVQKIGKALLDQGFKEENFKVLDKNPEAAKIFWKGLGTKLHERGYMPSEDTIAAIRKYVTAARGLQEEATKTSIGQMMTEKVE